MKIKFLDKLRICKEVLLGKETHSWSERDKVGFIFNKGYKAGLSDAKLNGLLKLVVSSPSKNTEYAYTFDDIDKVQKFVQNIYFNNPDTDEYCELFQMFIDRDVSHLITESTGN